MTTLLALLAALAQGPVPPPPPVRLSSGVTPDTVTVGDRFVATIRLRLPAGASAAFDSVAASDTLQQVESARVHRDSAGAAFAEYPLVAWVAGLVPRASLAVRVTFPDRSEAVYRVPLRLPYVRSVLPADTAGLKPKPPKRVLPLPRPSSWHRLALLLLAVLTALGVIYWLYRRRGRAAAVRDARGEALAQLDALAADAGDPAYLYAAAVRALRRYLTAVDPTLGEHRTSTELLHAGALSRGGRGATAALARLLRQADPVKFGGVRPGAAEAATFVREVRAWVAGYPPQHESSTTGEAA